MRSDINLYRKDRVYTNKKWVDTSSTVAKCWQHKNVDIVMEPYNHDQRLVVVLATPKQVHRRCPANVHL